MLSTLMVMRFRGDTGLGLIDHLSGVISVALVFALGWYTSTRVGLTSLAVLVSAAEYDERYLNPFVIVVGVGPWLAARLVRGRQEVAHQLAARAAELEDERDLFARESVRYERARIARELHDLVAHSVSMMVVQATAGQRLLELDPPLAAQALATIAQAGRQAQAEMAQLVDLLATAPDADDSMSLALIDELVARSQATGLAVTYTVRGNLDRLSGEPAATIYRIVQEALTNALKHSPGAPISIDVDSTGSATRVSITNGPSQTAAKPLHHLGGGNGLRGMRERAADLGAVILLGPTAEGGWQVSVELPTGSLRCDAESA